MLKGGADRFHYQSTLQFSPSGKYRQRLARPWRCEQRPRRPCPGSQPWRLGPLGELGLRRLVHGRRLRQPLLSGRKFHLLWTDISSARWVRSRPWEQRVHAEIRRLMASLSAQQVALPASDRGNCRCSSSATDKTFCPTHSTGQCHVCVDINIMFHLISLSFLVNDFDFFLSSCAKEERKKKKKNLLFADLPESPDARGVQVGCSQFFCTNQPNHPNQPKNPNRTSLDRVARGRLGRDHSQSWDPPHQQGLSSIQTRHHYSLSMNVTFRAVSHSWNLRKW